MFVLICYDVNVQSDDERRRLRKLARQCENHGIRVQNSVFECVLDPAEWELLKSKLTKTINPDKDSLRFYYLGKKYDTKIEHVGAKTVVKVEGTLIL